MNKTVLAAIFVLWIVRAGAQPPAKPGIIWMTGPLEKVLQDKGTPGSVRSITVHTTRNEIQSFQIHVHAGDGPINALSVTVSDLTNAAAKSRVSSASTDIVVYREAYMDVTIPTARGATFLNTTGPIPDILIPAVDPYYRQRTNAFPFTVAAGKNQSVWIDVHIPANTAPGNYSGTVTVQDGTAVLAVLPVVYVVWDWEMPSTSSLPSFMAASYGGFCFQVYGKAGCGAYPDALGNPDAGATFANVDAAVQMLDNRYSLAGIANIFPGAGSFADFDKIYGPLLDGAKAHVPSILRGAKLTSYNIPVLTNQFNSSTFQNFQKHFAAKRWIEPSYALNDEPNPNDADVWKALVAKGTQVHGFSTPSVPTFVTTDIVNATKYGALAAIDWLVVNLVSLEPGGSAPMQDLSAYQKWLSASPARRFWSYQGCSDAGTCTSGKVGPEYTGQTNSYPNYNVDGTPVANRTLEWLTFLHGQTGELYYYLDVCDGPGYEAGECSHSRTGVMSPLVSNYYKGGWGDGTLMYPGSSAYVGTKIPIWLPSMRLKTIRDGMQDYEYLNALKNLGEGEFALQHLRTFITNSYTFNNNPVALEAARETLGTKLDELMRARQGGKKAH
jgi:hypothetical protein